MVRKAAPKGKKDEVKADAAETQKEKVENNEISNEEAVNAELEAEEAEATELETDKEEQEKAEEETPAAEEAAPETEEAEDFNGPDVPKELAEGVRRILAGTMIVLAGSEYQLAEDMVIRFDGEDHAFAGLLASLGPNVVGRHSAYLRLKYNGFGALMPLGSQCQPEEVADFVPTLSLAEAMELGLTREQYETYCNAKTKREAKAEKTEESAG